MATYIVKKGDTLSEIAEQYYESYGYSSLKSYQDYLVQRNEISNPDYIVVGQVLQLNGAVPTSSISNSRAIVQSFGLLSSSDSELYASWTWNKASTENYRVKWTYQDPNFSDWIIGSESTVTTKQSKFNIPEGATKVRFTVKPMAYKRTKNGKEYYPWTASWSLAKTHYVKDTPDAPSAPSVSIDKCKVTASVSNLDTDVKYVRFEVVRSDQKRVYTFLADTFFTAATMSYTGNVGYSYKVRCRAEVGKDDVVSDWSDYSSEVYSPPAVPKIRKYRAESETSVYLEWATVKNADSYDIEYATELEYFDGSNLTNTVSSIDTTHYLLGNLQTGSRYYFRVRACRGSQAGEWSEPIVSVIIGTEPVAPTTWSSTTTAIVGEDVILYWVHNSEDGSLETVAEIEYIVGDSTDPISVTLRNTSDDEIQTRSYTLATDSYTEGTKIKWRVRTSGVTNKSGDWSIQRSIDIYAQPTLDLKMYDVNDNVLATPDAPGNLDIFPFNISGVPGPNTQAPIGYYLSVTSNNTYETTDSVGNVIYIKAGDQVYSKYFDINQSLSVDFSAGDIDLESNASYTITCVASMDSGLTVEKSLIFQVMWADLDHEPNAEIAIDEESVTASIRPYCEDGTGAPIEGVLLSVYRREFDGGFTEIDSNIENGVGKFVTDPHPALDYARYRVVAITEATGAVSYCDIAPYPVGEKAIIIQWDEDWSSFEGEIDGEFETPNWTGSLLRLPYNIDVSENIQSDVSLVEYVGRKHPVSYYGTQLGESATWNVVIEKNDEETLYALRRLQKWMGNAYVREPSGSGYWANVVVTFAQRHKELTIPVTIKITRVEGGV